MFSGLNRDGADPSGAIRSAHNPDEGISGATGSTTSSVTRPNLLMPRPGGTRDENGAVKSEDTVLLKLISDHQFGAPDQVVGALMRVDAQREYISPFLVVNRHEPTTLFPSQQTARFDTIPNSMWSKI